MTISDLALAEMLAEAAGQAIRPWFRRPFLVETKEDFSPVTAADKEAEAAIRSAEASLNTSKLDLEFTAVHAPISGRIGQALGLQ